MRARRACDRCHAVKEKCRWIPDQASCERCHRLRFPCLSQRSIAVSGRKPRYQRVKAEQGRETRLARSEGSPSASSPASTATDAPVQRTTTASPVYVPQTLSVFAGFNDREMQLLNDAFQGRTRIDQFLIGPSFRMSHYKAFARQLGVSLPWVHDALVSSCAFIACEAASGPIHTDLAIRYKRAASAMSTLRSLGTVDAKDPVIFLMIAIGAVTFALHISGNALPICRHSLGVIKPLYESSLELNSDCLSFLISLIHSETAECLFRCEIPTLRFKVKDPSFVDRFLGIASPMLPYLYDLCTISYALCHDEHVDRPATMKALDALEDAVGSWTPILPEDFDSRFLQEEVLSMVAQAKVYRWSILLIAHRLRYPYGTETSKGAVLSDAILEELDMSIKTTNRSIPYANIAFGVACFEIMDTRKRQIALDKTDVFVEFSKRLQTRIKAAILAFWSIRDKHDQLYWCEIIPLLPPSVP